MIVERDTPNHINYYSKTVLLIDECAPPPHTYQRAWSMCPSSPYLPEGLVNVPLLPMPTRGLGQCALLPTPTRGLGQCAPPPHTYQRAWSVFPSSPYLPECVVTLIRCLIRYFSSSKFTLGSLCMASLSWANRSGEACPTLAGKAEVGVALAHICLNCSLTNNHVVPFCAYQCVLIVELPFPLSPSPTSLPLPSHPSPPPPTLPYPFLPTLP